MRFWVKGGDEAGSSAAWTASGFGISRGPALGAPLGQLAEGLRGRARAGEGPVLRGGGREGYGRPRERTEPFEFDAICMFLGDLHGYLHGYCMYLDDLHVCLHIFK